MRERREALGLSRERLARLADVSSASVELFEGGWRPQRSRVLPAVMAALARAEAERELAHHKNGALAINEDAVKTIDAGDRREPRV